LRADIEILSILVSVGGRFGRTAVPEKSPWMTGSLRYAPLKLGRLDRRLFGSV
jgi:hypothetical protein